MCWHAMQVPPAAKDIIQRLMCDVEDRLGTGGVHEIKVGIKWGQGSSESRSKRY